MDREFMHHQIFKHPTGTQQDTMQGKAKYGKIAMNR